MKPVPMQPNLPEATTALGTVVKPKQWYECPHCEKSSPLHEREWVGLTEDDLVDTLWPVTLTGVVRLVETKLKEKNFGPYTASE